MNKTILKLIESDIISSKFIKGFNNLGIDASNYLIDMSKIVFQLMGIKKANRTGDLYATYYKMLSKGSGIDVNSKEQLKKLAIEIYSKLLHYS